MINPNVLRELASIARSSELHDLKVGLEPDQVDEIASEIEALRNTLKESAYAYLELCQAVSGITNASGHRKLRQLLLRGGQPTTQDT